MIAKEWCRKGLTSLEVQGRLKKFGQNRPSDSRGFSNLGLFISQFESPLVYVLVLAGAIALFLQDYPDATVIYSAVFLNVILSFYQERKAQKALAALYSLLTPKAKVIRDGIQREIETAEIVPGDLVVLTIGDKAPADGILVEATDLTMNEAILTGESVAVDKEAVRYPLEKFWNQKKFFSSKERIFAGTTVTTGIGKMIVTQTGMKTKMGKIGKKMEKIREEKTPLQIQFGKLANILALIVGVISLSIFLFGRFLGYGLLEMFTISVAVAVAAIPEGLIVTLTVILALGMERILKKKAIVRKLLAAEILGSVSVICSDKTGTLTEGKMRVVEAITAISGREDSGDRRKMKKELLIKGAILCNDMRDPLELAMFEWAEEETKKKIEKIKENYPRVDEIPFSSQYKYIATLHKCLSGESSEGGFSPKKESYILFFSGAPEVILERCKIEENERKKWQRKFNECGEKGYRLVGFAYSEIDTPISKIKNSNLKNLLWLGILVYEDPVRKGVKEALIECRRAGIKVKVITGDYAPTAIAVLRKLGLVEKKWLTSNKWVMTGEELAKISDEEFKKKVEEIILFARTSPEQKLKIVQILKEKGEVVAMTGDGVNDALALKQADIGIVVGNASDVAKETADMILLDSNFATIVHAVEEGRIIFENIKKVTLYLLFCSFAEIILIGGSLVFGLPLPLTAGQILWINLFQDSLPAVALAFESKEGELMKDVPRKRDEAIIDFPMRILIFVVGIIVDILLLGLVMASTRGKLPFRFNQTMIFVTLGIISSSAVFACRSLRRPIYMYNPFANIFLTLSVFLGLIFLSLAVYSPFLQILLETTPLRLSEWIFVLGLGMLNFLAIEITKWNFIIKRKKSVYDRMIA